MEGPIVTKPTAVIIEMDEERDRKACIALDLKVTAANRELAQWLLDHPHIPRRRLPPGLAAAGAGSRSSGLGHEWVCCGHRAPAEG
jgi:hypothetical protein